jgi:hypothetical protein
LAGGDQFHRTFGVASPQQNTPQRFSALVYGDNGFHVSYNSPEKTKKTSAVGNLNSFTKRLRRWKKPNRPSCGITYSPVWFYFLRKCA